MVFGVMFSTNSPSSLPQHLRDMFLSAKIVAIKFILAEANILKCLKSSPLRSFMDDLSDKSTNFDELQIQVD